ncbi:MAG: SBBP repeat-containing protein, partial [candidate division Zixibacteria bacterium]|nr:SBBP repeat-containing protein [candidate division Zixibacteria bacterium]
GNSYDVAYDIAVDSFGNVYVTGWSDGGGPSLDYTTLKYYPNGDTAWVRRYVGPANSANFAYAIGVDRSGNVCVTGGSMGNGTSFDYATIKYYPNGDIAWVRRYNGLGNNLDEATAIAIDGSGNVCVTGYSYCNETNDDYVTIKYYANGDTAWVRRYNGTENYSDWPYAIAVDSSNNVYVTGASHGSGTSMDYTTIKYYPNGDTAWVRKYNGTGNSYDVAYDIAVDFSGNVYVTGYSVAGGPASDYTTIKYYPNGDTAWMRRYNGLGNYGDEASAIALDGFGNVYVTGKSWNGINYDCTTIKYYPNGDTAWVRSYDGTGNSGDYVHAIAVDGSGNVYVTGYSMGSWTNFDYVTIKYVQTPVEVKDETGNREKPSEFTLSQNYPNPFNQSTKIEFTLSHSGLVSLNIYDLLGRGIRTLVLENLTPGYKSVVWDGKDDKGNEVASGIYFYQLKVKDFSEAKKLVLLK